MDQEKKKLSSNIISLKAFKFKKEIEEKSKLYPNRQEHLKNSDLPKLDNNSKSFTARDKELIMERMERIRATVQKINRIMKELKSMSNTQKTKDVN